MYKLSHVIYNGILKKFRSRLMIRAILMYSDEQNSPPTQANYTLLTCIIAGVIFVILVVALGVAIFVYRRFYKAKVEPSEPEKTIVEGQETKIIVRGGKSYASGLESSMAVKVKNETAAIQAAQKVIVGGKKDDYVEPPPVSSMAVKVKENQQMLQEVLRKKRVEESPPVSSMALKVKERQEAIQKAQEAKKILAPRKA